MSYTYTDYHHHQFDKRFSLPLPMPSPTSCWYPQRQDVQFGYSYPDPEYTLLLQIAQPHQPTWWDNPWQPPQQYQHPIPSPPYQPPPYTPDWEPNLSMAALVSQLERLTADVEQLVSRMDATERCPVDPHAAIQPPPAPPLSIPYTTPVLCPLQQPTIVSPAVLHHVPHQVSMSYSPDRSSYSAAPYDLQSLVNRDTVGSLQQPHHCRKQLAEPFTKDAAHIEHPLASIAKLESFLDDTDRHVGGLHTQPRPPPAPPNGQLSGSHMGPFLELQIEQVVKVEEKLLDDEGDGGSNPLSVIDSVKSPLGCISTPLEYISTVLESSEWKKCINGSLEDLQESNDLYLHIIWRSSSKFTDIYYEVHFVKMVEPDVVVKLLDEKIKRLSPFATRLSIDAPPLRMVTEIADLVKITTCVYVVWHVGDVTIVNHRSIFCGTDARLVPPCNPLQLMDRTSLPQFAGPETLGQPQTFHAGYQHGHQLYSHQISATSAVDQPFYKASDAAAPPLQEPDRKMGVFAEIESHLAITDRRVDSLRPPDLPEPETPNAPPVWQQPTSGLLSGLNLPPQAQPPPVVQTLLLPPTSTCFSAVMPPAAIDVPILLKEAQYLSGEKVVGVIVASPHKEVREAKSMVNLSELFATFANDVIWIVALGRKYGDSEEFTKVTEELGKRLDVLLGSLDEGKFVPWLCWIKFVNGISGRVRRVARNINEFLEFVVIEHVGERKEGEMDYVDVWLEVPRNERCGFVLDDISIKALIMDMFATGSDTTFTLIERMLSELIRHKKAKKSYFSWWMSLHFISFVQVVNICIHWIRVGIPCQNFCSPHSSFCRGFHLEDKVNFNLGGVDTIISQLFSCLFDLPYLSNLYLDICFLFNKLG